MGGLLKCSLRSKCVWSPAGRQAGGVERGCWSCPGPSAPRPGRFSALASAQRERSGSWPGSPDMGGGAGGGRRDRGFLVPSPGPPHPPPAHQGPARPCSPPRCWGHQRRLSAAPGPARRQAEDMAWTRQPRAAWAPGRTSRGPGMEPFEPSLQGAPESSPGVPNWGTSREWAAGGHCSSQPGPGTPWATPPAFPLLWAHV